MIGLQDCGQTTEATSPRHSSGSGSASSVQSPGGRLPANSPDNCNGYVRKARLVAGLFSNARSSFNDRHHNSARARSAVQRSPLPLSDTLYRSNSSLELPENRGSSRGYGIGDSLLQHLRQREYGSHGSIDLLETTVKSGNALQQRHRHQQVSTSTTGDAFFAMLQDYRPAALDNDQRSPGPSEFLRSRSENHDGIVEGCDSTDTGACGSHPSGVPQSPKLRAKLRFWNSAGAADNNNMLSPVAGAGAGAVSSEAEEIARRRAFAHYDCQSLSTTLYFTRRLRCMFLNRRRNTTTGASAASMTTRSSTPDGENEDDEYDDGQSNELVKCCPVFRNEIGGEEERVVSLTRLHAFQQNSNAGRKVIHRPPLAYGVSVLEFPPGETHWRQSTCPYQRLSRPIEWVDQGALYYRKYFLGQEHQNWFGIDEQLGPVAISIKREKVVHPEGQKLSSSVIMQHQYRLIIRTSELNTLRGAILEDAIPNIRSSNNSKSINTKEVLEYVAPEVQLSSLRLGTTDPQTEEQLLKVDEQGLMRCYKVGVMYCKADQAGEEEMYNNETGGPAFAEFLETIGEKVRLKGFAKYKAGLDNKNDSTGLYSVYTQYQDCEVMFHVSTMLPFTPNNRQQLLRKRHIGNDIVTIVFQEPGAKPFTPKGIRSQFQHVFILVRVINPNTENTLYKVAVSRSRDVPVFGPPIRPGGVYPKGKAFAEFLLGKIVNAENAAHRSEKFLTMATRTRQEYLKDLVHNQSTNVLVESGQKFSIFSSKKKDKIRPRFIPDACQRGAVLWQVSLDDSGSSRSLDCFLGISADSLVLIEELSEQIVFVTPCRSVLGWSPQTASLKIYHHQGECVTIHMRDSHVDRDELVEIMDRLKATTQGAQAQEISLTRNIMGQLGFHVQPDGIVTLVESAGQAWAAGLRQNSRLVEICKVAVATLKHDQMVDLLKTSLPVTLTVIPPLQDTSPRKGCTLQNCKYNEGNYEGDYENLGTGEGGGKTKLAPQRQQAVPGNHKRIYERSFSPPRSSNSSGYGTGTSCKSSYHNNPDPSKFATVNAGEECVATDPTADKWYDFLADPDSPAPANANTFPSTPRRNNGSSSATTGAAAAAVNNSYQINQLQLSQSHTHFPSVLNHGKVQSSHSLPLQHGGALFKHDETVDLAYKLEKNNVVKQQNERLRQDNDLLYYRQRSPRSVAHIANDLGRSGNDGHSTDGSVIAGSEDELSNGSGTASPGPRKPGRGAGGGGGSRNQSPRSLNGEAKLKSARSSSNRNSANLSGSNFQEELLRLINPDTMESAMDPVRLTKEPLSHRSQENVNSTTNQLSMHKSAPEVILTTARPATVISSSSAASSPLSGDFKSSKEEVNNGVSRKLQHRLEHGGSLSTMVPEEFPLPEDVDWPSLVDTATKHLRVKGDCAAGRSRAWDEGPVAVAGDRSIASSLSSTTSVPELRGHISELETRVLKETRKRMSLENEVQLLKEENRKLHEQAHAAVQQLRKFTEWFFRNVEKR